MKMVERLITHMASPALLLLLFINTSSCNYRWISYLLRFGRVPHGTPAYTALQRKIEKIFRRAEINRLAAIERVRLWNEQDHDPDDLEEWGRPSDADMSASTTPILNEFDPAQSKYFHLIFLNFNFLQSKNWTL